MTSTARHSSPPPRLSQFVIARSQATRQSSRHRHVPGQPTGLPRRDFVPPRNDNERGPGIHFHDNERSVYVLSSPTFAPLRLSQFVIARSAATRQSSRHRYVPGAPTGLPRRDFVPPRNDNKRSAYVHFHDGEGGARNPFPASILQPPFSPPRRLSQFVIARSAATRQSSRHSYVPRAPDWIATSGLRPSSQ